jgi:hypothetical protein
VLRLPRRNKRFGGLGPDVVGSDKYWDDSDPHLGWRPFATEALRDYLSAR